MMLAVEANSVIALRLMKLMRGRKPPVAKPA
jgi:hypothetical protein